MVIFYCVFLLLLGLVVYKSHSKYLYHYLLIWMCFGPVVINVFFTIKTEYYNIFTWIIYLGYIIALDTIVKRGFGNKWNKRVLYLIIILVVYYTSLSFLRGTSMISSLKYITGHVAFLFFLCLISLIKHDVRSLMKLIKKIVYIELILALLQPYTDLLNFHAALHGDGVMTTFVNGTFIRNNIFVEFMTPLVMILLYYDYKINNKIKIGNIILVCVGLYVTYNSGVRTATIAIFPIILIFLYYRLESVFKFKTKRGRVVALLISSSIFYMGYSFINQIAKDTGVTYTQNATDSSERQTVLLSMLNDEDFAEEQTTLGLSFVVLSTFWENPFIGSGKLLQGKGYGGFISIDAGNETDATLAIYLCETGVIGVVFLFFIYFTIIYKVGNDYMLTKLIFIYLLIVTISDPGIFFIGNMILLFISISVCNHLQSQGLLKIIKKGY